MRFLITITMLTLVSCASTSKWSVEGQNQTPVTAKYEHGEVVITPVESRPHSQAKDMLIVKTKITNNSDKLLKVSPAHIYVKMKDGSSAPPMSAQEVDSYYGKQAVMASAIAGGGLVGSQITNSTIKNEIDALRLNNKPIPPKSFIEGQQWFLIPKNGVEKVTFEFYETLKSDQKITLIKQKKSYSTRRPASK